MARGQNRQGKNTVEAADKRAKALELRRAGAGYQRIADAVGYSNPGTAHKQVRIALREMLQQAGSEELRTLEAARLERLHLAIWPKAIGGDRDAVMMVLRIADRRARLLGLDAPVKLQHGGKPDHPVVVKVVNGVSTDEL